MNHISHVLFFVLKICQNPNPGDAQLSDTTLATRYTSHQSKKLDTIFKIQVIGCYCFQGWHPV